MCALVQRISSKEWAALCAVAVAGYGVARLTQKLFSCPPGLPAPDIPDAKEDSYVLGVLKRTFFRHFYVVRRGESLLCLKKWCEEYQNRPFVMKIFLHSHIVVSDPQDAEELLVRQEAVCPKGFGYDLVRSVIGDGLLAVCDRKKHQRHRRLLAPLFSTENVKLISNEVTRRYSIQLLGRLLSRCQEGASAGGDESANLTTVNLTAFINAMALSAIGEGAFCASPDESVQVRVHFDTMMKFTKANYFCPYLRNKSQRSARAAVATITDTLLSRHLRSVDELESDDEDSRDDAGLRMPRHRTVLAALMENLDGAFTPDDVVDHLVTFLFAGHDTTSHTLQMLLALLAAHPRVQEKLHSILVDEVMPNVGSFPTVEALLSCDYLCAVVDEVLRLYPAAPLIYRDTSDDVHLPSSGVVVPKNSTVVISIFSIHRNKAVYGADADSFCPERWLGTAGVALRARCGGCGYMPFSRGRRNCIGQDFGYQEALLVTAYLVRYLSFHAAGEFPVTRFLITMSTKEAVQVRLAAREGFDADTLIHTINASLAEHRDEARRPPQRDKVPSSASEQDENDSRAGAATGEIQTPLSGSFLSSTDSAQTIVEATLTPRVVAGVD